MSTPCSTSLGRLCRAYIASPVAHEPTTSALRAGLQNSPRILSRRFLSTPLGRRKDAKLSENLDGIYDDLTSTPPPQASSTTAKTSKEETLAKARVVFGSRLAGPAERQRELDGASTTIAGIRVPPRPIEPDNCCMSGCVNCVWDRYQDEVEDWAAKSAEARAKLEAMRKEEPGKEAAVGKTNEMQRVFAAASSMDDDGGGSEALWGSAGAEEGVLGTGEKAEDLMQGVPIGIREFMRNERRLKERKAAAAAVV